MIRLPMPVSSTKAIRRVPEVTLFSTGFWLVGSSSWRIEPGHKRKFIILITEHGCQAGSAGQ